MPIRVNGAIYYRTAEAARIAGVSRSTLLRWVESGIIEDTPRRDRRGWRLFTEDAVKKIKVEASKIEESDRGGRASRQPW